jgi:multidrug resistance protein, MATE family
MPREKAEYQQVQKDDHDDDDDDEEESEKLLDSSDSGADDLVDEDLSKISVVTEGKSLFKLALPMVFGQFINMLGWQVNLVLIGHIGALELGASAMARMWMGISAYAILFGGQMSLDTLRAQAYGAQSYELVGILTQRGILIVTLLCIPCGLSWIFLTAPVLKMIGVPDEVAQLSQLYCKIAVGNLWPLLSQQMAIGFLRCQRIVKPVTYVAAATQCITLPIAYLLITKYGMIGGAMAESVNGWIMFGTTLGLIQWKGYQKKCWHGWTRRALEDWAPILKLGAAGSLQSFVQMSSFEFTAAMASTLGAIPLAAHSCSANLTFLMFPIVGTTGLMATTVRVGNLLGEGRPKQGVTLPLPYTPPCPPLASLLGSLPKPQSCCSLAHSLLSVNDVYIYVPACVGSVCTARLNGKASVVLCTAIVCGFAILLQIFRYDFARLYSADEEVIAKAGSIAPQVGGYLVFFGMVMSFRGTVGGCGKQIISARLGTFTWYCVGLPLGALFCFQFGMGLSGLWWGLVVGGTFQGASETAPLPATGSGGPAHSARSPCADRLTDVVWRGAVTCFYIWLGHRLDWAAESRKARANAKGRQKPKAKP